MSYIWVVSIIFKIQMNLSKSFPNPNMNWIVVLKLVSIHFFTHVLLKTRKKHSLSCQSYYIPSYHHQIYCFSRIANWPKSTICSGIETNWDYVLHINAWYEFTLFVAPMSPKWWTHIFYNTNNQNSVISGELPKKFGAEEILSI